MHYDVAINHFLQFNLGKDLLCGEVFFISDLLFERDIIKLKMALESGKGLFEFVQFMTGKL